MPHRMRRQKRERLTKIGKEGRGREREREMREKEGKEEEVVAAVVVEEVGTHS